MTNIKIVTEYCKCDTDFSSDYLGVSLYIDEKLIRSYGDYYHEKGDIRADAFVDAIEFLKGKDLVSVEKEKVCSDEQCWC
jgi:hypothetical protein